jgi:hypothetical protein
MTRIKEGKKQGGADEGRWWECNENEERKRGRKEEREKGGKDGRTEGRKDGRTE